MKQSTEKKHRKIRSSEKFNFLIGRPADDGSGAITTHFAFGTNIWFGTQEDADWTLKFVKDRTKTSAWKIIKVENKGE